MSHILLSVLFTGLMMSCTSTAAETISNSPASQIIQSTPILDENFLTKNDWRKWQYRLSTRADINGDGKGEKVWVIADIKQDPNSSFDNVKWLYDEGAPWAVVIETHEGEQTLVYLAWSQFGRVHAFVVDKENQSSVLIVNRQTGAIGIYELKYQAPDRYTIYPILERNIQAFAH